MASFYINYVGKVQPQQRPRHRVVTAKNGRVFTQTYEAKDSRDFKASLHLLAQSELENSGQFMIEKACVISVTFRTAIPQSFSKKKAEQALAGDIKPEKKPDVDNILKAVMDALNGVLYADDKLIVNASVMKRYARHEGLSIYVYEAGNEK